MDVNSVECQVMFQQKDRFLGYIITLIALMLYASPFLMSVDVEIKFAFTMVILVYALQKRKLRNIKNIFLVLIAVYGLIIIQAVSYGGFTNAGIYKPLLLFLTPFLLFLLLGLSYFKYLFWIIYYDAIFTSAIWLMLILIPPFDILLQKYSEIVFRVSLKTKLLIKS